jgi:hypothetical protein
MDIFVERQRDLRLNLVRHDWIEYKTTTFLRPANMIGLERQIISQEQGTVGKIKETNQAARGAAEQWTSCCTANIWN